MAGTGFESALEKAKIKRLISDQLAPLSYAARRDVLADLMLAIDDAETDDAHTVVPKANGLVRPRPRKRRGTRRVVGKRPLKKVGTKKQAIFDYLNAHPRAPIADVAEIVYGDRGETHRVRAILWQLKTAGRVNNPEAGQWEVTA